MVKLQLFIFSFEAKKYFLCAIEMPYGTHIRLTILIKNNTGIILQKFIFGILQ